MHTPTGEIWNTLSKRRAKSQKLAQEALATEAEEARVVLSTEFYEELVAHAVPIDLRALKALKGSPLAGVLHVYPAARLTEQSTGLLLRPSPTHLPR